MNLSQGRINSQTPFISSSAFEIYKKIIKGKVDYPEFMNEQLKDLIKKILISDTSLRFGCRNVN